MPESERRQPTQQPTSPHILNERRLRGSAVAVLQLGGRGTSGIGGQLTDRFKIVMQRERTRQRLSSQK